MENNNIKPEKITKPIQLLAAWLIGLILIVSALLTAAATIKNPEWIPAFFSISAIAIIPLFLILIFLLQTRYRPQMQEDEFYSKYLNSNTMEKETTSIDFIIEKVTRKIDEKIFELSSITQDQIEIINENIIELSSKSNNGEMEILRRKPIALKGFQGFIKGASNDISFNIKLEKANEILAHLSKLNIKVNDFFGTREDRVKPEIFLFSFGANVDYEILKILIIELQKFGLTHLRVVEEPDRENNIYIGSYAYKGHEGANYKMTAITAQINEEIINCSSAQEIYIKVLQNMK
jgi:hypothetical protein